MTWFASLVPRLEPVFCCPAPMRSLVVTIDDPFHYHRLQLRERETCILLRVVIATLLDIREGGTREVVDKPQVLCAEKRSTAPFL